MQFMGKGSGAVVLIIFSSCRTEVVLCFPSNGRTVAAQNRALRRHLLRILAWPPSRICCEREASWMLCSVLFPHPARGRTVIPERGANMQFTLNILEDKSATSSAWQQLTKEQQKAVIEVLARLIAQAAVCQQTEEPSHD